jgi:hypothetical protein
MPPLSGFGPANPGLSRTSLSSVQPSRLMPPRESLITSQPIDKLESTPDSRSGSSSSNVEVVDIEGSRIRVGGTPDSNAQASRTAQFTADNSTDSAGVAQLTQAEIDRNNAAVEARRSGIMGCIGKQTTPAPTPGCNPCDTAECLKGLLTGNLLDQDGKKLLCDMTRATERALKRQIDSAGDSLLSAAEAIASAKAAKAPLQVLNSFLGKLDPGAVAKCFGAQQLIDKAKNELRKVNKTLSDAERGVHDKLATKFNQATEAAQQFSIVPNVCG